ncbi:hypothetical protein AVEN_44321-1 [Araneus ventricosus]|uniref:Uncharacterized protein n=1 Tax=Araneus ventricosus TaxID=182803 RepID=A0A4Y2PFI3_ARAVE|nr:hypothetical protein AVEN_44321-1 [Araneus ventricosus]
MYRKSSELLDEWLLRLKTLFEVLSAVRAAEAGEFIVIPSAVTVIISDLLSICAANLYNCCFSCHLCFLEYSYDAWAHCVCGGADTDAFSLGIQNISANVKKSNFKKSYGLI